MSVVGGQPRIIAGPGEYEIKGIVISGVPTYRDAERGKKRGKNTAYVFELDDLVVGDLGELGHVLTTDQVDQMRNIDVLLIPVGGGPTLDAGQAVEVISLLEPKIVVPMEFRTGDLDPELDPVDKFLREMGIAGAEPQPKLTVSKSTLTEATVVVVLEARLR
jgi:L-ascorbate metabolism protein UlaG (beta-lactamase superfamily)